MRRIAGVVLAFIVLTGTFLVLPVYAAPQPEATPVAPSIDTVDLGSVDRPEDEAVVTTDGVVVDAGPAAAAGAPASPSQPAPVPTGAPVDPADDEDAVASSGAEVEGVPALTVSQSATRRFSTVGVTWAADPAATGVTVQIRTQDSGGTWSDWTALEVEDAQGGDPDADLRAGTAPYWTDEAYGIETVVQAADGSTPRDVQLTLIDPGTSRADAVPGAPAATDQAHADNAMPAIYSRAQWGADERLMGWGAEYAPTLKAATVHHTADSNSYAAEDVPRILRSIYAYHAVTLGWGDIGYNVVVDKFGRAWEGRAGGLASTVVGAHAGGFNTGTFGISMLGNYDVTAVPQAVVETVANVVAWKFSLYGIDPRGTVTLTSGGGGTAKYAKGQSVTLPTLFAHRDVGSTACPGRYGFSRMGELRSLVAERTTVAAAVSPTGPRTLLRNSAGGGLAEWTTTRGDAGDIPFACDWDGTGNQTIGIFRAGLVYVFNSNASTARHEYSFRFGDAGDTPLCGDWDGDGKDTIGIWRQGVFFLKNANTTGIADGVFPFGNRDAQPVVGDWNGDGYDTVGVYQNATFYWADSNLRPYADGQQPFGDRGDVVVVGDWNGKGRDTFGVFRAGKFLLATSLARAQADLRFSYGDRDDTPVTADWNGDGTTTVGIIRDY